MKVLKNKSWLFMGLFLLPLFVNAQQPQCGTTIEDQLLIKQRMLQNRKQVPASDIAAIQHGRTPTYVPLSIHNIADVNGNGFASMDAIYDMVCDLNNNYADQNIQFFIYDTVHMRKDFHLHDDPGSQTSRNKINQLFKVPNTVNMFISTSVNGPNSSWYNGAGDYVVIRKSMMAPGKSATETHELGHFFTLAHTFFGWEGIDADATYGGGNAPSTLGFWGFPVERVARTGSNANCAVAADGFCDTPADYYSDRLPCNHAPQVNDPTGAALSPDKGYYMSYYLDACVDSFSAEQKGAMAADIAARTWVTQTPPSTATLSASNITVTAPLDGASIDLSTPTTTLDWAPLAGANFYHVQLYLAAGTFIYTQFGPILDQVVYAGDELTIDNSLLNATYQGIVWDDFAWRIRPLNEYYTCTEHSTYTSFSRSTITSIDAVAAKQKMDMQVMPNPATGNTATVKVLSTSDVEASLQLYSIQGQLIIEQTGQFMNKGENVFNISLDNIPSGTYIVALNTAQGAIRKKLMIQR